MTQEAAKRWYVVRSPEGTYFMGSVKGYFNVTPEHAYRFDYRNDAFEIAKRDGAEVYIVNMTCTRVKEDGT